MKSIIIRIIGAVPGVVMLINGVGWIIQPAQTAKSLGMPLLDGIARSTQVGDLGAFFLCCGGFVFLGAFRAEGRWYYAGAFMLVMAAVIRSYSHLFLGADLATQFIVAELVMSGWLVVGGFFVNREINPR